MLSLHKLFLNAGAPDSFDEVIAPTDSQRRTLVVAKNAIRDHLRADIRAATTTVLGMDRMVTPRFRTQGSWAYKTCVQAAHRPPQEMDWDFGVYLPVTVWDEHAPPARMAKLYFELVERSLAQLCEREGWRLERGNTRCVRIRIADWAHIDVPLYAAPEAEFHQVVEKAVALNSAHHPYLHLRESVALDEAPEPFWELLDEIHVATRDGRWLPSDPEAVAKWFDDQVLVHGEQLRRVCCYLKAWRDYHWRDGGGPSSVLIMIVVTQTFDATPRRDDLAVERAAMTLARALGDGVYERSIDGGEEDFNRMSSGERLIAVQRAESLAHQMSLSRHFGPGLRQTAVDNVRAQFGPRIADNCELVIADDGTGVRRVPAAQVVPPVVGATKAG